MMSNRELYQKTFSQVHSSTDIQWEDMEAMRPKKRISKNLLALAAVITLSAILSTVAAATDLFGLRSWLLPEKTTVQAPDGQGYLEPVEVDAITLSGYTDTPEGRATAEWNVFLDGYDTMAAAQDADRNPGQLDSKYALYKVYNREMADKLDEIVEKYGLILHTEIIDAYEHPEAMEDILKALGDNQAYSTYFFEDGTLHYDGEYYLPDYGKVDYQFSRYVRGTFNEVILNVGDVSAYEEWTYRTACGQAVTLALGPTKSLLLADLGDSFVTLNVLAGTETDPADIFSSGPISASDLEALADSFDFTKLTPAIPPRVEAETAEAGWAIPAEDTFLMSTGVEEAMAQNFYCGFIRAVEEDRREDVATMIAWPRTVFTQEGSVLVENWEDFLPYYDDVFTEDLLEAIHENQYDHERADLICHDGMIGGAGGDIWFALLEDDRMAVLTVQNPEGNSIRYDGPAGITAE